jgi:hypothetical protein
VVIRLASVLGLIATGCLIVVTIALGHIAGWW